MKLLVQNPLLARKTPFVDGGEDEQILACLDPMRGFDHPTVESIRDLRRLVQELLTDDVLDFVKGSADPNTAIVDASLGNGGVFFNIGMHRTVSSRLSSPLNPALLTA